MTPIKTRKTQFLLLSILLVFFINAFFLLGTVFAEPTSGSNYHLLAPIDTITPSDTSKGITLVDYMKGIFVATIGIAIVLAVVQIVLGGIQYVAAAVPSSKEDAKKRISGAVGGLLLILLAYVLLETLNPELLNVGLNLEKIAAVKGDEGVLTPPTPPQWCIFNKQTGQPAGGGTYATEEECKSDTPSGLNVECRLCNDTKTNGECPATNAEYIEGDNAARAQLEAGGVSVKSNQCTSCGQSGCTSVYGLPQSAISGLIALKKSCNCEVVVTGGTEAGHKTHDIGKAIVDLRHTPSLDAFLKNTTCTKSGRPVYGNSGNYYWDEDSAHFHVTFGASQC